MTGTRTAMTVGLEGIALAAEIRRHSSLRTVALLAALFGALASWDARLAWGADPQPGEDVILKPGAALPDAPGRIADAQTYRRYRVAMVEKGRLQVVSGAISGWIAAGDAIPCTQAVRYFTQVIREHPDASWAYNRRAIAWLDKHEPDIAIGDFTEAIQIDPKNALAYGNRGLAWLEKKDYRRAIADFTEAIRLMPNDAAPYHDRGLARLETGAIDGAIADFTTAVRVNPRDAASFRDRGVALARLGQFPRAAADYGRALRLDPQDAWAQNGLAWLLATCPSSTERDGRKAVALATRANDLSGWKNPYQLGTLAAAEAENGNFVDAVNWQSRALEIFSTDDPELPGHRARLVMYRLKTPYREGAPQP